ncbi:MAG: hypothetical protein H6813_06325 [Phycisphaeraceae bacterium]|nr:hypothetical protein [Phycisphaeraceae bacterium]
MHDLLDATIDNRVAWKQSPRDNTFTVAISVNSISISKATYPDVRDIDYILAITDADGKFLDSVLYEEDNPDYPAARELWEMALRKARRINETLDEISRLLKEGGKIGEFDIDE